MKRPDMRKPQLTDYIITPEQYARYRQQSRASTGDSRIRFSAFFLCLTSMVGGIVTFVVTLIVSRDVGEPIAFGILGMFLLGTIYAVMVEQFRKPRAPKGPLRDRINQYEAAITAYKEAERARVKAERARLDLQRAAERKRREAQQADKRARWEAERARQASLRAERRKRLDHWLSLRGIQFEQELAALYRHLGYQVRATPKSGDQGIDLILTKDGEITIVQCKGQKGPATPAVVRELYGSFYAFEGASHAILARTGGFTQRVKDFAIGKPITLISTIEMAKMAGSVVRSQQQRQLAPKKPAPVSVPEVESSEAERQGQPISKVTPANRRVSSVCPDCGSKLNLYTGSDSYTGLDSMFWRCSGYPECTFRRSRY